VHLLILDERNTEELCSCDDPDICSIRTSNYEGIETNLKTEWEFVVRWRNSEQRGWPARVPCLRGAPRGPSGPCPNLFSTTHAHGRSQVRPATRDNPEPPVDVSPEDIPEYQRARDNGLLVTYVKYADGSICKEYPGQSVSCYVDPYVVVG